MLQYHHIEATFSVHEFWWDMYIQSLHFSLLSLCLLKLYPSLVPQLEFYHKGNWHKLCPVIVHFLFDLPACQLSAMSSEPATTQMLLFSAASKLVGQESYPLRLLAYPIWNPPDFFTFYVNIWSIPLTPFPTSKLELQLEATMHRFCWGYWESKLSSSRLHNKCFANVAISLAGLRKTKSVQNIYNTHSV